MIGDANINNKHFGIRSIEKRIQSMSSIYYLEGEERNHTHFLTLFVE